MPPATAAPPRKSLDDKALEEELEAQRGPDSEEDDGLGPSGEQEQPEVSQEEYDDPNSEYNTGIPGGRKPGDDGYVEPENAAGETGGEGGSPPTPPAKLPEGEGAGESEDEPERLAILGDRELGLKVGGRKPDSASLHLKGGRIELTGPKGSQFDRGDRFLTVTTLQVTGDNDQDTIEKISGDVRSTSKKQSATLCGIARLEDWVEERVRDKRLTAEQVDWLFDVLELEKSE
jgi:hypothetical protein